MADVVLVTGANGFVGSALCRRLQDEGLSVRAAVRDRSNIPLNGQVQGSGDEWVVLHDQSSEGDIQQALHGVQTVVHLAARVHVMVDHATDPLLEFRHANRDWTERIARMAAQEGVRRFVYMSSIKVNGEETHAPFTEDNVPNPRDPYGISKWEAEQALATLSEKTGLESVVLRPPLVYGPGVRGNFLQLLNVVRKGIPLPLDSVDNRRSLIYRENLVDALIHCVQDRRAAGRTYLVSDGEDLSTAELIRRLAKSLKKDPPLWPLPLWVLRVIGKFAGKTAMIDRLLGSLQIDSSRIRRELDWHPPYSVDRGIEETASWFLRGFGAARRS
ncbi:MAG: SDR family oxidoreductase [Nitrospira sp.]|nr:SDR family oxidoreductase [Nitrospira sp.]